MSERQEIKWASFARGVRIHASAMETPAIAKDGAVRIFRGVVHGDMSLIVEDPSLPDPVVVPWHNVGTVVYLPVADAPEIAAKKPIVKAKGEAQA